MEFIKRKANDDFGKIRNTIMYHPLKDDPLKQSYSDGVKDMIDAHPCKWIVEIILRDQYGDKYEHPEFQVWQLMHLKGTAYSMVLMNGDTREYIHQKVVYGDFPYERLSLWFIEGKLLFPSEFKRML